MSGGDQVQDGGVAQLAAEADLRAMGLLASGLSHSLGTPLTSVMNNLNLIRRQLEREARNGQSGPFMAALSRESEEALAGVDRLERIVRAMRDSFAVRPGTVEPVLVDEVIATTLDAFERLDDGHHLITRHLEVAPLLVNRAKLQRVALILLHNAAAAAPAGACIDATVRAFPERVELCVEDEGDGIPSDIAELVFEPFFTTRPESVGLGLTIARSFVMVHGGTLRHEPRGEEPGTRFVASFPRLTPGAARARPRTGRD